MSAIEETITAAPAKLRPRAGDQPSLVSRFLKLFCSVRLGVGLLIALGLACLIGMLIMQQNVDGFDRYFAELTPSQRLVYGRLGFFDIYHAWYFNALLAVLSLNIVLASIDRFPKIWTFASKPSRTVPVRWLRDQKASETIKINGGGSSDISNRISSAMKNAGWKKPTTSERNGKTFVFAQSGLWNRFGFIAVHIALLTIFTGGFLTAQMGSTGQMPLMPGETSNIMRETVVDLDQANEITKRLPFEVTCTDIEQKLIRKDGPITVGNTIDWFTRFTIKDETGTHEGFVQMNQPFDYRGYRFFQASFIPTGRARNITVRVTPESGPTADLVIPRGGLATLPNGNQVKFAEFRGNFRIGQEDPNEDTSSYPNPGAILQVFQPPNPPQTAYAFGPQMADLPVAKKPVAGYTFQLIDFEKASDRHILAIQRDPGSNVVYVGFVLLFITLVAVFFFSHQRVWAAIEKKPDGSYDVTLAGNSNRNQNAFNEKFKRFAGNLREQRAGGES